MIILFISIIIIYTIIIIGYIFFKFYDFKCSKCFTTPKKKKEQYKVGDWVTWENSKESIQWYEDNEVFLYGKKAKIISVETTNKYIIQFKDYINGHSGDGRGEIGHCKYAYRKDIKKYHLSEKEKADSILEKINNNFPKYVLNKDVIKAQNQQKENKRLTIYSQELLNKKFSQNEIARNRFNTFMQKLNQSIESNIQKVYEITYLLLSLSKNLQDKNEKLEEKIEVKNKQISILLDANEQVLAELNVCLLNIFDLNDYNNKKTDVIFIMSELEKLYELIKKFK